MPQSNLLQRSNPEILTSEEKIKFIIYMLIYTEWQQGEEETTKGLMDPCVMDLVHNIQWVLFNHGHFLANSNFI